jgi:hypothetical protein
MRFLSGVAAGTMRARLEHPRAIERPLENNCVASEKEDRAVARAMAGHAPRLAKTIPSGANPATFATMSGTSSFPWKIPARSAALHGCT